jgi:hypothetical protein
MEKYTTIFSCAFSLLISLSSCWGHLALKKVIALIKGEPRTKMENLSEKNRILGADKHKHMTFYRVHFVTVTALQL